MLNCLQVNETVESIELLFAEIGGKGLASTGHPSARKAERAE